MDIRTQSALLASIIGLALGLSMLAAGGASAGAHALLRLRADGGRVLPVQLLPQRLPASASYPWVSPRGGGGHACCWARWSRAPRWPSSWSSWGCARARTWLGRRLAVLSAVLRPRGGGDAPRRTALGAGGHGRLGARRAAGLGVAAGPTGCAPPSRASSGCGCSTWPSAPRRPSSSRRSTSSARFGIPFPTLGPVFSTLYLFFLAQTLLRLRLMDLHELLGKIASQTVLAVILAAVFVVLTAWVDEQHARCSSSTRWWPPS